MRFKPVKTLYFGLALLSGGVIVPKAAMADAESQGYTIEEVQACSGDAMRLCKDAIPDIGKIESCMESKKPQLSKACLAMFAPDRKR